MDDSATISTEKHSQIQSGQFMVSKLDDSDSEQECKSPDNPIEAPQVDRASGVPAFDNLQSLFNRLRLAHYENLTSPRWSHFKGAGFALENKVRLNNIIWREYHMQYVKQLSPVIVKFSMPAQDTNHENPDTISLDGKFRRRQTENLRNDYRRWRIFFKNNLRKKPTPRSEKRMLDFEMPSNLVQKMPYLEDRDLFNDLPGVGSPNRIEDIISDFDSNLDLFLDQPFPTSRDMAQLGNSDIIQPGLAQLQHNAQSYHSDLITSLLQQPAMPTISEDEYFISQYQLPPQQFYQPCPPVNNQASGSRFRFNYKPGPPPLEPIYRQPSYYYNPAASKQQPPSQEPVSYRQHQQRGLHFAPAPSEPPQQLEPPPPKDLRRGVTKSPDAPRNNLTLLNALLQEPKPNVTVLEESPLRDRHSSGPSTDASLFMPLMVPVQAPSMSQPTRQQQQQKYQRERSSSVNGPLVVDMSKQSECLPMDVSILQPSMYMDDFPPPNDQPLRLDVRCQAVGQQNPIPPVAQQPIRESALYGYHQNSVRPHRPSTERFLKTCAFPESIQTSSNSAFRRGPGAVVFHPNQLYRLTGNSNPGNAVSSIASAPDLYGSYRAAMATGTTSNTGYYSPSSNDTTKHDSSLEEESPLISTMADVAAATGDSDDGGMMLQLNFHPSPTDDSPVHQGNTEQRRRMSMQSCLQLLHDLIKKSVPEIAGASSVASSVNSTLRGCQQLQQQQQLKMSKAAILQEAAELIRKQKLEKAHMDTEINRLQSEIELLENSINVCCEKLPVSGAPPTRQTRTCSVETTDWYHRFVAASSQANWKFYIFGLIFRDLFDIYCEKVCPTSSRDVLRRSTISWIEDHCDLPHLRRCKFTRGFS